MTLSLAALASGTGSNVLAIYRAIEQGRLDARIALVLSNNPQAPVVEQARQRGLSVWARCHGGYADRQTFDQDLARAIHQAGADTIVLAGYMRLLSPEFVRRFAGRILNVHPALLPSFAGTGGARDAVQYGVRITGVTVHFVDEIMDNGPIIIQAALPLKAEETAEELLPRLHAMEHRLFPQALQWLAQNRLVLEGRRVRLLPPPRSPDRPAIWQGGRETDSWLISPGLEDF